jgi:hypothetical protein
MYITALYYFMSTEGVVQMESEDVVPFSDQSLPTHAESVSSRFLETHALSKQTPSVRFIITSLILS